MEDGEVEQPKTEWQNTVRGIDRLRQSHPWLYEESSREAPHGFFAGRRIIGRDTPINEGVYVGSGAREAIVVDDARYPAELVGAYRDLRSRMAVEQRKPESLRKSTFQLIYDIAKENLGGNLGEREIENRLGNMLQRYTGSFRGVSQKGEDTKVALNVFMKEKVGVCRHRALLAGYLLERLVKDNVLRGKVSIDRNTIPARGGHAWVRWEGPGGKAFIIDPSLGYVGPIERSPRIWSYERPRR